MSAEASVAVLAASPAASGEAREDAHPLSASASAIGATPASPARHE
jgi:hypothetical protein